MKNFQGIAMPMSANSAQGIITSWDKSDPEWKALRSIRADLDVRMLCCNLPGVMKTSKLGTHFFAHKVRDDCSSKPETADHLFLKASIARIAAANGWQVTLERPGVTKAGEEWIADIYCVRGSHKIAVEIQWSQQTMAEFERRQARYAESGVRAIWLYRTKQDAGWCDRGVRSDYSLPVFFFSKLGEGQYYMPLLHMPVQKFMEQVFRGALKWQPSRNSLARVAVLGVDHECAECGYSAPTLCAISYYMSAPYINDIYPISSDILRKIRSHRHFRNAPARLIGRIINVKYQENFRLFKGVVDYRIYLCCLKCGGKHVMRSLRDKYDACDPSDLKIIWSSNIRYHDMPKRVKHNWSLAGLDITKLGSNVEILPSAKYVPHNK